MPRSPWSAKSSVKRLLGLIKAANVEYTTMNKLVIRALNKMRRLTAGEVQAPDHGSTLPVDSREQDAGDLIREKLLGERPCMITRFGHTELKVCVRHWRRRKGFARNAWRYVAGRQGPFWWNTDIREAVKYMGFFPCTDETLARFSDRYIRDLGEIDVLGTWLRDEAELKDHFAAAKVVPLEDLEPFFHRSPWTTALEGRTVLAIHPFESSIQKQYARRSRLFSDPRILPDFKLKTFKAVQSIGGDGGEFKDWFGALDWMCKRIQEIEFDVALIGAGAYGLPLAAFVKRLGRKAVHLGGATQLLFGIRGKRWEQWPSYQKLFNENWSRPLQEETPACHQLVDEGKSYW